MRIGTLHEGQVLIVHHVFRPDDSLQTLDVGALLPAHATRAGQGPARRPPATSPAERGARRSESFTPATITDPESAASASSSASRERGWAADIGELVNGQVSLRGADPSTGAA